MRRFGSGLIALCCVLTVLAAARPSHALDAFDGRLQVHGYYEAQIRSLVRDYNFADNWDLTQWWNVLSIEIEGNVAPDGWGPFDNINLFSRIEVRYDCVWTRACTLFDSANAYGPHIRKLPGRLSDFRRSGYAGTQFIDDTRHLYDTPFVDVNTTPDKARLRPSGEQKPLTFFQSPVGQAFFGSGSYGLDGIPAFQNVVIDGRDTQIQTSTDDPPLLYFQKMLRPHCDEWSARGRSNGSQDGRGNLDILLLDPACDYRTIGEDRDKPNPFRADDVNPITGNAGVGELPYRPAPKFDFNSGAPEEFARGTYYPNYRLQQLLAEDRIRPWNTQFRRDELAWNHGESQKEQKELKELYADVEMFDSRLWMRIGYQTIVWGKTELFRNQDQWNPQDVALGSLTSLEESRISLWAIRAIWSFYDIGPFNDVRLEVAANFDQFEPTDLGSCGEPYTVVAACALSVGQVVHGYFGFGLAGQQRPPDPWDNAKGLEYGARLEFRWDRFSFALTDFYGFQDFPYVQQVFSYSRNVDPVTGRPRHTETTGRCKSGKESACLDADNALTQASVNQTLFSIVCAGTVGIAPTLDANSCFANVFGSPAGTEISPGVPGPRIVVALNTVFGGDFGNAGLIFPTLGEFPADGSVQAAIAKMTFNGQAKVTVNLNKDPFDGPDPDYVNASPKNQLIHASDFAATVDAFYNPAGAFKMSLSGRLTDQQEALIGCGKFYHTSCDLDGIDLLNAEASVLVQSWPDTTGTFRGPNAVWDTTDKGLTQPGTVGFQGGPACTRFENGKTFILPGCRGPRDSGYNVKEDGTVSNVHQPFTGQQFQNELGGLSWNLLDEPGRPLAAAARLRRDDGPAPRARPLELRRQRPVPPRRLLLRRAAVVLERDGLPRPHGRAPQQHPRRRQRHLRASRLRLGVGRHGHRCASTRRNILGFSMDFAEDLTKTNWGIEFTWVDGLHLADNDSTSGLDKTDSYRLTISVDRPTFVNFLNANRTFFFNTQWFFEYEPSYHRGYLNDGAWDIVRRLLGHHRLLPGPPAALAGAGLLRDEQLVRGAAGDHLPLHRELLGDVRPRGLRRPRGDAPDADRTSSAISTERFGRTPTSRRWRTAWP